MKNPTEQNRNSIFWVRIVLFLINIFFWLLTIFGTLYPQNRLSTLFVILGIFITPISLLLWCFGQLFITAIKESKTTVKTENLIHQRNMSAKPSREFDKPKEIVKEIIGNNNNPAKETNDSSANKLENQEWCSQSDIASIGAVLIIIGMLTAIIVFPTTPMFALLLFALIGGLGIFTAYKVNNFSALIGGLVLVSWGYVAYGILLFDHKRFSNALFSDSIIVIVISTVLLGTLIFALLTQKRFGHHTVTTFEKLLPCIVIIIPFLIVGVQDYNVRGATSPPQIIPLKVVDKYIEEYERSDPDYLSSAMVTEYHVIAETVDGKQQFSFTVYSNYYDEHDIGSSCELILCTGALGYTWIEGYN